jgi:hypothetical protein
LCFESCQMTKPRMIKGLEPELWSSIFLIVSREHPESLQSISGTCSTFAAISRRGQLWARRWFNA